MAGDDDTGGIGTGARGLGERSVSASSDIGGDATLRGYDLRRPSAAEQHSRGICEWEPLTVMVVEDDDHVRELCVRTLADEGHDVVSAGSAEDATALLEGAAAPPHLLITDVVMPGIDGVALARALQGRLLDLDGQSPLQSRLVGAAPGDGTGGGDQPTAETGGTIRKSGSVVGTATLLISGHNPTDVGIDTDEFAFLAKPFTPDELLDAAQDALLARPGRPKFDNIVPKRGGAGSGAGARAAGGFMQFGSIDGDSKARTERNDGRRATVGFGSFIMPKRAAATAAALAVVVLAVGAVLLAGGGGRTELAVDEAASETDDAPGPDPEIGGESGTGDFIAEVFGSEEPQDGSPPDGPQPGDTTSDQERPGDGRTHITVTGENATQADGEQSSDVPPASEPGTGTGTSSEEDTTHEPIAVAYEPPTWGAPELASCTISGDGDRREHAVTYTLDSRGGSYDVLPGEPFLGNDDRVEVRGGTLTWTVETTHTREPGDEADSFFVNAPSVLGWAEPGGAARQHTHQPPPLEVHVERCRRG